MKYCALYKNKTNLYFMVCFIPESCCFCFVLFFPTVEGMGWKTGTFSYLVDVIHVRDVSGAISLINSWWR